MPPGLTLHAAVDGELDTSSTMPLEALLGSPFVVKPTEGSGGAGVEFDATCTADAASYFRRTGYPKAVVQRCVVPRVLDGRCAWFRVFWVNDLVPPCWWDETTHVYDEATADEEATLELAPLRPMTARIAAAAGIDFFITEIAVDQDGDLVSVDFVNEMPDLRLQSQHTDGVPDHVVERIADELAEMAIAGHPPMETPLHR